MINIGYYDEMLFYYSVMEVFVCHVDNNNYSVYMHSYIQNLVAQSL